jgi:hypothetical protein
MPGVATHRNVNFLAVTFTPTGGGTAITLTGVVDIKRNQAGKTIKFKGDNDLYPTTICPDGGEPSVVISTADLIDLLSLPVGTVGSFSYTHLDARNRTATGAGSITYTGANCIVSDVSDGGTHAQFGMGQITIDGISADGQANPFAATVGTV